MPVANGEPGIGLSAPSSPTENIATVLSLALATASKPPVATPPEGLNATA